MTEEKQRQRLSDYLVSGWCLNPADLPNLKYERDPLDRQSVSDRNTIVIVRRGCSRWNLDSVLTVGDSVLTVGNSVLTVGDSINCFVVR